MVEAELVAGVLDGDPVAERRFYDEHVDAVYRLALRMAGDAELARRFTQDAFVRAFERIGQFRGDARLSTWLHSVTTSVVVDGLRKRKRFLSRELPLDEAPTRVVSGEPRIEPDLRRRLHEELVDLPDIYRVVVVMHDLEGYTHDEIAEALDIAPGTSRARLSRAREKLRDALDAFAGEAIA